LIGLVAAGVLVAGFAVARELRGPLAPTRPMVFGPMVNVGSDGDPITAVRFYFVPEGTAPQPFPSDTSAYRGSHPLAAIADKLPTRLPEPGARGTCGGVEVTFQLRSGRELNYSRCGRPDVVIQFLRAVGVVPPWQ
jgi:hypothetical protein